MQQRQLIQIYGYRKHIEKLLCCLRNLVRKKSAKLLEGLQFHLYSHHVDRELVLGPRFHTELDWCDREFCSLPCFFLKWKHVGVTKLLCLLWGLNSEPSDYETDALPTALRRLWGKKVSVELSILFHVYTNFLRSYIFQTECKIRVCAVAYILLLWVRHNDQIISGFHPRINMQHGEFFFSHYDLNGNPLQYPCLENLMDRGAWWAAVHGVAKSWTWLSG